MYLYDGFRALATFGVFPGIELRAREIHWPEVDGGGGIDTTVMANATLRTMAPKGLLTIGKITMTAQYDPKIWVTMFAGMALGLRVNGVNTVGIINRPTSMTLTAPDTGSLVLYVFINKFTPQPFKEGDFPMAEVEIIPTNVNPNATTITGQMAHDTLPTATAGIRPDQVIA